MKSVFCWNMFLALCSCNNLVIKSHSYTSACKINVCSLIKCCVWHLNSCMFTQEKRFSCEQQSTFRLMHFYSSHFHRRCRVIVETLGVIELQSLSSEEVGVRECCSSQLRAELTSHHDSIIKHQLYKRLCHVLSHTDCCWKLSLSCRSLHQSLHGLEGNKWLLNVHLMRGNAELGMDENVLFTYVERTMGGRRKC